MAESTLNTGGAGTAPKKRFGWLKLIGLLCAALLLLCVAAYFVATSAGFFKGVILPRVGKTINADVTVGDASISPFSRVVLRDLKVQPRNAEPLLTAAEVRLQYNLLDILGGKMNISEIAVVSPTITLVENADGTSNLGPILKAVASAPAPPAPAENKAEKPMQVDVKSLVVTNATVRRVKHYDPTHKDVVELADGFIGLQNLKNGQTGKVDLAGRFRVDTAPPAPGTNGFFGGTINGSFSLALGQDLQPGNIQGKARLLVGDAGGAMAAAAGFSGDLNCDLTPTEVKEAVLRFAKGDINLGEARVSGPFPSNLLVTLQVPLDKLARLCPEPSLRISSGTIEATARVSQNKDDLHVTANFGLNALTGVIGPNTFSNYTARAEADVMVTPSEVQIRKLSGSISEQGRLGGAFEAVGSYNLTNQLTRLTASMRGVNQDGLRPFLEPAFTGRKLVSLALDGTASVQYDSSGASSVKSDIILSNLVVVDPAVSAAPLRLEAKAGLDAGFAKQILDLRSAQLGLTPTPRAANVLQMSGKIDLSRTNLYSGDLKLTADALDLTSYYDLFAGGTNAAAQSPAPSKPPQTPAPGPTQTAGEPPAMTLPLTNFTLQASVGRFYLHEVVMTNIQAGVNLNGGKILVKPMSLTLNGAPLESTADLDLGVPGYRYDVSFQANQVPLAPLVNAFVPDRRGQVSGTLSGQAQVRGSGTTGASLQTNLVGNFDIGTTNLNLAIAELRSKLLRSLVNVVAVVPEIVRNPSGALTSLGGALFTKSSAPRGGWSEELLNSPIDIIQARGTMGKGKVELENALVQSPAFRAAARGTVTLAAELTNSACNIPLNIAVRYALADQVKLVPPGTPTNAAYVPLPDYVALSGTIGEPDYKLNKKALLGTVLQQYGGMIPGLDKQTGQLIQNLGTKLTGSGTNAPAAGGTNQPAGSLGGLLQGLGSVLGKPQSTNAPAGSTNQPPATNQAPAGSLLDQLLGPKKKK